MEKKMETTIMGYIRVIFGLDRDNGKEHGNYYLGFRIGGPIFFDLFFFFFGDLFFFLVLSLGASSNFY